MLRQRLLCIMQIVYISYIKNGILLPDIDQYYFSVQKICELEIIGQTGVLQGDILVLVLANVDIIMDIYDLPCSISRKHLL